MSKVLSQLLEHPESAVSKLIGQLEAKNGYPSHDVRATADNIQDIRRKIAELKLDPNDTTAEELYHALLIKFENDARRFDEHFGMHAKSYDDKIQKAAELVSHNITLPERWALKNTAAKQLLRQHPPKRLMKQLSYRSADSFIKRENLAEVYLAVEFIETAAWNKAHFKLASALDSTCFEMRPLKLQALGSRCGNVDSGDTYVSSSDYGVLGILPNELVKSMSLLALVVLLLDEADAAPSQAANFSPAAAWWAGTDKVIANLGGAPVSLNLKDVALSHLNSEEPSRSTAQRHFWQDLLGRYENQLPAQEDILAALETPIKKLQTPLNQPAFEYVEDI